jgi:hypothetical protein
VLHSIHEDSMNSFASARFPTLLLSTRGMTNLSVVTNASKNETDYSVELLLLSGIATEVPFRCHFRLAHWTARGILRNNKDADGLLQVKAPRSTQQKSEARVLRQKAASGSLQDSVPLAGVDGTCHTGTALLQGKEYVPQGTASWTPRRKAESKANAGITAKELCGPECFISGSSPRTSICASEPSFGEAR